jgi:hypothetical protein
VIPRPNQIAIGAIVALGLLLAAFWAYRNVELYEREVEIGQTAEVRANPYFALVRFIEGYGAAVGTFPVYSRPPPPGATLYFPAERAALSDRQNAELRAFAESGGHLIVVARTLWEERDKTPDPLLDPLGAGQFEHEPPPSPKSQPMQCPAPEDQASWWKPEARPVSLPDGSGTLMLRFDPRFLVKEMTGPALWRLADDFGTHALNYRVGKGAITVLTDDLLLYNDQIGKDDHAAFAAWLLAPRPGAVVWIVRDHEAPPLWDWVYRHAGPALFASGVALAVWLWGRTRRFGPIAPDPLPERRSLVEHIAASGRFLWQHGLSATLVSATVLALRQRVRARHPHWAGLPQAELAPRLAAFTGLPETRIARALSARAAISGERFAHDIETLESLRRTL